MGSATAPAVFTQQQIDRGEHLRWMDTHDLVDLVTMKATHLVAMLQTTYGGGAEAFRSLGAAEQDEYMWACATMASELRATIRELTTQARRKAP